MNEHGEDMVIENRTWTQPSGWILDRLISADAAIALPTVLAERSLVRDVGGFDESVRLCEDYDLWFRFGLRSPVLFVPEMLTKVRRHSNNYSDYANKPGEMDRWWLYICKKMYRSTNNPKAKLACEHQFAFRMGRLTGHEGSTGESGNT